MPRYACLLGNGLSSTYNADLRIEPLTNGLITRFQALAGTTAGNALAAYTQTLTGQPRSDFEGLLGPLDTTAEALPFLQHLGMGILTPPDLAAALDVVRQHAMSVHRVGQATALNLIADRTHGQGEPTFDATIGAVCQALLALPGHKTIATLNYDGLLHAGLIDAANVADLALGYNAVARPTRLGGPARQCWPLRTEANFPATVTTEILQLHGSLGWLRDPTGAVWRFRIDDLRTDGYWQALAGGATDLAPCVVLTDRKTRAVAWEPFALAYGIFGRSLALAERWLIAGYSFLDAPVNVALRDALTARKGLGLPAPEILVLDFGVEAERRQAAEQGFGPGVAFTLDVMGLPDSVATPTWAGWAT